MKPLIFALLSALGSTAFSIADQSAPPPQPVVRELTDVSGRKLKGAIISKTETSVRFRKSSDGQEYDLPISKLSPEDQKFIENFGKPAEIDTSKFQIEFNGKPTEVTRVGNGPLGVLCFGSTSNTIKQQIPAEKEKFRGLLPDKISFFLWEYPHDGVFKEIYATLDAYEAGDEKKIRPDFSGVASTVLAQVRQKTGLKEFILVGNSLGVGVVLWDYNKLVADPAVRFLLVAPTEAFLPPVSSLGKLQKTMLLASHGKSDDGREIDGYLKGKEARRWVESNLDTKTLRRISTEPQIGPVIRGQKPPPDPLKMDFSRGHPIIGYHMKCELFAELLKMHLEP